jgi:hypothetical protein
MNDEQLAVLNELSETNPDALLADGLKEAFIGICHRFGQPPLASYDYNKCLEILARDMTIEEAMEYFEYNTLGAWMGENTPVFIQTDIL